MNVNNSSDRRRVIYAFRTNLTCGDSNCQRHSSSSRRESLKSFQETENTLRTAMRHSRKTSVRYQGSVVRLIYFSGMKGNPMQVCGTAAVGGIRDRLTLCSK